MTFEPKMPTIGFLKKTKQHLKKQSLYTLFFFHFYYPVLGTGGGEKHTETTTSPFLSQLLIHVYNKDVHAINN